MVTTQITIIYLRMLSFKYLDQKRIHKYSCNFPFSLWNSYICVNKSQIAEKLQNIYFYFCFNSRLLKVNQLDIGIQFKFNQEIFQTFSHLKTWFKIKLLWFFSLKKKLKPLFMMIWFKILFHYCFKKKKFEKRWIEILWVL